MKVGKLKEMTGGWFIGDFEPTFYKTSDFEVAVHFYKKNQFHDVHYHAVATEINCIISGKMTLQGQTLEAGDLFTLNPYEIADPIFLEDTTIVIVKTPSKPGDKFIFGTDKQ